MNLAQESKNINLHPQIVIDTGQEGERQGGNGTSYYQVEEFRNCKEGFKNRNKGDVKATDYG